MVSRGLTVIPLPSTFTLVRAVLAERSMLVRLLYAKFTLVSLVFCERSTEVSFEHEA